MTIQRNVISLTESRQRKEITELIKQQNITETVNDKIVYNRVTNEIVRERKKELQGQISFLKSFTKCWRVKAEIFVQMFNINYQYRHSYERLEK